MVTGAATEALADFKRRMAEAEAEADRDARALAERDAGFIAEVVDLVGALVGEMNARDVLCHRVSYTGSYDLREKVSTIKVNILPQPVPRILNAQVPDITMVLYADVIHVNKTACEGRQLAAVFSAIVEVFGATYGAKRVRNELPAVDSAGGEPGHHDGGP